MKPTKPEDILLIRSLHSLIFNNKKINSELVKTFAKIRKELYSDKYVLPYISSDFPIEIFKTELPYTQQIIINLCRLFLIKKDTKMANPERHKNSIQRLVSFRNSGDIYSADRPENNSYFSDYPLKNPDDNLQEIIECWDIVPINVWHYPKANNSGDWYTIAFHSVSSIDMIEETL